MFAGLVLAGLECCIECDVLTGNLSAQAYEVGVSGHAVGVVLLACGVAAVF
jgi:hypothetical protein